jgi:hypothetical protein
MRWIDGWMVLLDGAGISYFEGQGMGFLSLRFASLLSLLMTLFLRGV